MWQTQADGNLKWNFRLQQSAMPDFPYKLTCFKIDFVSKKYGGKRNIDVLT